MQSLDGQDLIERRLEELREHDHNFPDRKRPLTALTEAIVWCVKVHADALTLEASAKARRPMADVMGIPDDGRNALMTAALGRSDRALEAWRSWGRSAWPPRSWWLSRCWPR